MAVTLTRAQFLANGLQEISLIVTNEECCICTDNFVCPVKLPCNHIYCRSCITIWLTESKNTCPKCRCTLFQLEQLEQSSPVPEQMVRVNRAAALAAQERAAAPEANNIGSIPTTQARLDRAYAAARAYLAYNHGIVPRGSFTVDLRFLEANIVAMGTLLPALAAIDGRSYSPNEKAHWHQILSKLWVLLTRIPAHRTFEASTFAPWVRTMLMQRMQAINGIDTSRMAAFDGNPHPGENRPYNDLTVLFRFMAQVSLDRDEEIEARRRVAEEREVMIRRNEKPCVVM